MADMGTLQYFLSVQVSLNMEGLFLDQSKYTRDLLLQHGIKDCEPLATPVHSHGQIGKKVEFLTFRCYFIS